jgi:hypothetical protein
VKTVKINMGAPILDCKDVPVKFEGKMISQPVDVDGMKVVGTAVSMGNPHFVTFDDLDDATIDILGPKLECHPVFPRKANIEFAKVKDGKFLGMDIELPEGSPERVAAVIDGEKAIVLGDGNGCVMTVDGEITDGAPAL